MALRSLPYDLTDRLGRVFYPAAIATVLVVLLTVQVYLETEFVVFGLYALVGLAAGAAVYYGTDDVAERMRLRIDDRLHRTGVYVASALTVGVVAITEEPLVVLAGLALGYALVVRQLFADPTPAEVVPQITALFLLSPLTKYLTSGQYVGHGDVFDHVRIVSDLVGAESLGAIAYSSYQDFPGLHLVAGAVGSLSGLGAYDGLMLTGLAAYAVLIPAVYLVVARVTDYPLLALYTAFSVAVLDDVTFYASYVFPQSIATVLVVVLALLATLAASDARKWRGAGAFALVAVALSVTHHLTQVLFAPVVALALVLYAVRGRDYARTAFTSRATALTAFAAAVTAVRLVRTGFVDRLVAKGGLLLAGGARGGYTRGVTLSLGRPPRSSSVSAALDWLVSPYGVYLVLLLLVFSIGVVAFLRAADRPGAQTALFWTGLVGAVLVFETPVSVQSLIRIRSPWLFVFAFVVGVGLLQLRRRVGATRRSQVLLAVIVALAATGPVVTADDYYDLDPRPTVQSSFSDREVAELRALSGYVSEREEPTTTFWLTRLALERYGAEGFRNPRLDGRTLVVPEGHFVYRSQWPHHKVHFTAGSGDRLYSNTLYVSEGWLDRRVGAGNKVYSAGGTGVMWRDSPRPFGNL